MYSEIITAIEDSVSPDLLSSEWAKRVKPNEHPVSGHCAKAAEAFYYMVGGKAAGFVPTYCVYYEGTRGALYFNEAPHPQSALRSTHWWIRGPKDGQAGKGEVYDPSVKQYEGYPFPYQFGVGAGFQHPKQMPSDKAQIIINRATEKIGLSQVSEFQLENIERFQSALKAKP